MPVAGQSELIYPPSLVDMDGDGDLDVVVQQKLLNTETGLAYYENTLCSSILENGVEKNNVSLKAKQDGVNYQWFDCNTGEDIVGANQQSYQPVKNGKYGVKINDERGCENISTCIDFILSDVELEVIGNQISLFPNPAFDYFSLVNETKYKIDKISLSTTEGKLLKEFPYHNGGKISINEFAAGTYHIDITIGQWVISKKVIFIK